MLRLYHKVSLMQFSTLLFISLGIKEPTVLKCQILYCVAVSYFYLSSILYFSEAYIKVIFKELFLLFQLFSYLSFVLKNYPEKSIYRLCPGNYTQTTCMLCSSFFFAFGRQKDSAVLNQILNGTACYLRARDVTFYYTSFLCCVDKKYLCCFQFNCLPRFEDTEMA